MGEDSERDSTSRESSNWHVLTVEETLGKLATTKNGLSESEALRRASEFGPKSLIILAAVTFIFGTWATSKYLQKSDTKDPGTIVVDEAAGQLLTLALIPTEFWWYLFGFGLFRAADIIKPWPASWAERVLPGALGVMSDDIFAACYSMAILYIAHSFLTG